MCSCFVSFPGFFGYLLPLWRSFLSFLTSSLESLRSSKQSNQCSDQSNTAGPKFNNNRKIASKDLGITLGSRIDGRMRFLNSTSVFAKESDRLPLSKVSGKTHRNCYEEVAEQQPSRAQHSPPPHIHHAQDNHTPSAFHAVSDLRLPARGRAHKTKQSRASGCVLWKIHSQSKTPRTGYWDVLSLYRTENAMSTREPKIHSESDCSEV